MSRGVFGALKDAVLILDEIKRLNENVRKLADRVESLERKQIDAERERAVGAVRDQALITTIEAAMKAAAAESHARFIERIVRLEHAIAVTAPNRDRPLLGDDGER